MTPYQAHRDARLIELDMLTLIEEKYPDNHNFLPLLRNLSNRVGLLADRLQHLEQVSKENLRDAERWQLLVDPLVTWSMHSDRFMVFQDIPRGKRLLGQGKTITEAIDKALGYK